MNVLTIGGATQDIIISYQDAQVLHQTSGQETLSFLLLEEGKKLDIEQVNYYSGGGATNSAVSFSRLGFATTAFFKIGTDYQGEYIEQSLIQEQVSTKLIIKQADVMTSVSFVIAGPSGDKTTLVYRGASTALMPTEFSLPALQEYQVSYITSLSGKAMELLPQVAATTKTYGGWVVVNPGNSQLHAGAKILLEALPHIDILLLNHFEMNLLMHSLITTTSITTDSPAATSTWDKPVLLAGSITYKTIRYTLTQFLQEIFSRGPKIIVITNGSEGVYVATPQKILFHPSLPTQVVSTLGAGDAFGSCFTAMLLSGHTLEHAVTCGVLNSTSVIQYPDAKTGLLTQQELRAKLAVLPENLIQTYTLER